MSQNFTDSPFVMSDVVSPDLTEANVNFAALKSSFSGASTPADPIAGMWWFDTTSNMLKIRNEANSAWQDVWDFANNKPIVTNLSNEITLAMMDSTTKSPSGSVEGLRKLGTLSTDAAAGNDSRFIGAVVAGTQVIGRSDHEVVVEMPPASYLRLKEFDVLKEGTYRISWEYKTYHDYRLAKTYLYRNETVLHTYETSSTTYIPVTVDESGWSYGDKISIRGNATYGLMGENKIYIRNARVSVSYAEFGMPSYSHY